MAARIESGVVQFGDDWPGVFFRGDTAFAYASQLQEALEGLIVGQGPNPITLAMLRNLMAELQACDVHLQLPVTHLKPAEECLK